MEKTFIINAPWAFRTVWLFVKPLLAERIQGAVSILGGPKEYMPVLLQHVEESKLPEWLGQADASSRRQPWPEVGPWVQYMPDLARDKALETGKPTMEQPGGECVSSPRRQLL